MIRPSLHTLARGVMLAGSGWFLTACSADITPTAPLANTSERMQMRDGYGTIGSMGGEGNSTASATSGSDGSIEELTTVSTLARTIPLQRSVSASAVIGPKGGTLSIPSLGVTLDVPSGALESSVRLTITALPGDAIAYDLAPHGMTFNVPLRLQQRLNETNFSASAQLDGAKFNSVAQVDTQARSARVNEKLRAWLIGNDVSIYFKKFSGYLVSMS